MKVAVSTSSRKNSSNSTVTTDECDKIKREHLSEWHTYVSRLCLMRRTTNGNC
uniref:Uncharacterized protein n=1 Tax=Ascaris lumbricoides TaxID=6252 RepID=A0A0M3IPU5_ASCLU